MVKAIPEMAKPPETSKIALLARDRGNWSRTSRHATGRMPGSSAMVPNLGHPTSHEGLNWTDDNKALVTHNQ
jgi:hypothetical protein